jgi:hypothetical protein
VKDMIVVILVMLGIAVAYYSAIVLIVLSVGFVLWITMPLLRKVKNQRKRYEWK